MSVEIYQQFGIESSKKSGTSLEQQLYGFPEGLSFSEFQGLSPELRKQVILRNPIIQTDAYNRTMEHIEGDIAEAPSEYSLQFRKAEKGYLIVSGIYDVAQKIANIKITQDMLNFAKEYYEHAGGVNYFSPTKWQRVIDENGGRIPIEIDGLPEGSAVLPGDPVLKVKGPNELVAHFEPYFHHIFYQSLVATNAHDIALKIGSDRFIEVGLRGAETEEKHLMAVKSMYVGGGIKLTSSDMAAGINPAFKLVGTLGHRYVQSYETEEEAFRNAIDKLDSVTLLIDLNDSIKGIDLALKLKREYRNTGKKIWIRLDSGNVTDQALYALKSQQEFSLLDPDLDKIVVEGIEQIDDMVNIDQAVKNSMPDIDPTQFLLYGAGGLLISENTQRCDASTGFKLTKIGERNTMKFSNTPQKASIPGSPVIALVNGVRMIAQEDEGFISLFVPYYKNGQLLLKDDLETARANVRLSYQLIAPNLEDDVPTARSNKTNLLVEDISGKTFGLKGGEIYVGSK